MEISSFKNTSLALVLTLTVRPKSYQYNAQKCISNCMAKLISDPEVAIDVPFRLISRFNFHACNP
jgi:hypothetical protein